MTDGVIRVLYGSQTGTAEEVAGEVADGFARLGVDAASTSMNALSPTELSVTKLAVFVVSTYGDGEMPDNAQMFWSSLSDDGVPLMDDLTFAVIGLGDSGYDVFCAAGKDIDRRLGELGATRLADRLDCDVEFDDELEQWLGDVVPNLISAVGMSGVEMAGGVERAVANEARRRCSERVAARLVSERALCAPDADKDVRHLVLETESAVDYVVGDSLSVYPVNDGQLVSAIVDHLGLDPEELVDVPDGPVGFFEALQKRYEITVAFGELLDRLRMGESVTGDRFGPDCSATELRPRPNVYEAISMHRSPVLTAQSLIDLLRPLQSRTYSIASSPQVHGNHIHLAVRIFRFDGISGQWGGACSTFLADRVAQGDEVEVALSKNTVFRLPADDTAPLVMIGAGTGVAPYRGFLFERRARGASGKNWLLIGHRRRSSDYLYAEEMESFLDEGVLSRLDVAFSRDQDRKVYVQESIRSNAKAVYEWLEAGAYVYVCGDATDMAPAVEVALLEVIQGESGGDPASAAAYIDELRIKKRYLRDIY